MIVSTYQWRLLIGPHFQDYDWSGHTWDDVDDLPAVATTLTATLNSGVAFCTVASTSGFATVAGVWIGPNGTGQGWEYCGATKTSATGFDLWSRESVATRTHNGVHTSGATVAAWLKLAQNDGQFMLDRELDDAYCVGGWRGKVSGVLAPTWIMRNHHLCVVQFLSSGAWRNRLVGFLDSPTIDDDGEGLRRWEFNIFSSLDLGRRYGVRGFRAGEMDLLQFGKAEAQSELKQPWKELWSNDFLEAEPDLTAERAIDADASTLWISDTAVGTANFSGLPNGDPHWELMRPGWSSGVTVYSHSEMLLTGVFLQRPTGMTSKGYRWLELTLCDMGDHETVNPSILLVTETLAATLFVTDITDLDNNSMYPGEKIILCESEELFKAENPVQVAHIIEISSDWFDAVDVNGDTIAVMRSHGPYWMHGVTWGTGSGITASNVNPADEDYPDEFEWAGSQNVAAPTNGKCLRYNFHATGGVSTDPYDYWVCSRLGTPGYVVGNFVMEWKDEAPLTFPMNRGALMKPWILVTSPGMGIYLRDEITDVSPTVGEYLYFVDSSGMPNASGIDTSTTLQIDEEQFTINAKDESLGRVRIASRHANGSVADDHAAGAAVMAVEAGIATDAPKYTSIGWTRNGGTIYPVDFRVLTSRNLLVRTPDLDNYEDDYDTPIEVTGHASGSYSVTVNRRVKNLLIEITKLTEDPARARLNQICGIVDRSQYTSDRWLGDDATVGILIREMLLAIGIPSAAINLVADTPLIRDVMTSGAKMYDAVKDMASYGLARVLCALDSRITIQSDPFWLGGTLSGVATYARADIKTIRMVHQPGDAYAQLRLSWRTGVGDDEGVAYYPEDVTSVVGQVEDVGPVIVADAAEAATMLERRYFLDRYPWIVVIELATPSWTRAPGDIVTVQYDWDNEGHAIDSLCLVIGVHQEIADGVLSTTLELAIIERQAA